MFLVRMAFWLGLAVLILPVDKDKIDPAATDSISASSAIELAAGTLSDLSGFCTRKPDVCAKGYDAFIAFGAKAKYVSGAAYAYFNGENSDETASANPNAVVRTVPLKE